MGSVIGNGLGSGCSGKERGYTPSRHGGMAGAGAVQRFPEIESGEDAEKSLKHPEFFYENPLDTEFPFLYIQLASKKVITLSRR